MGDQGAAHRWVMRLTFLALALLVVFFRLLPLETTARSWAGPDLIVALAMAWSLRRPDYAPALSIAAVMLLTDLLFQRPPGLMAALVLIGCEQLKSRGRGLSSVPFPAEWLTVTGMLVAITFANRLVLALLAVDQAPLGLVLIQMLMTALCYPLVVAVTQFVFGVRKSAPGDLDSSGYRL